MIVLLYLHRYLYLIIYCDDEHIILYYYIRKLLTRVNLIHFFIYYNSLWIFIKRTDGLPESWIIRYIYTHARTREYITCTRYIQCIIYNAYIYRGITRKFFVDKMYNFYFISLNWNIILFKLLKIILYRND